ncbi:MAG: TonB family protein, partial [Pyrinomonadaceae bacterium]
RALGLSVADRTLPLEAVTDLEKMRETLELVITQSKDVGKDKAKTQDAMALLEEAANSRSMLARDEYDARRWRDEVADTREQITSSRSIVINAVNDGMPDTPVDQGQVAANTQASTQPGTSAQQPETKPVFQPVADPVRTSKPADTVGSGVQKTVMQSPVNQPIPDKKPADKQDPPKTLIISNPRSESKSTDVAKQTDTPADIVKDSGPLDVGSLLAYATRQQAPVYPLAAKNMRATGVVHVEVTVDENGDVAEVQKTSGPSLLQGAAKDAIKKWRFRPFVRDGQPVKATGFVNFNFSL